MSTNLTYAQYVKILSKLNLKMIYMEPDGNCLFRAFSSHLYGNQKHFNDVRVTLMEYLTNNQEEYKHFCDDNLDISDYIANMSKDGIWGGELELRIFSKLYKINVHVHVLNNQDVIHENDSEDWIHLYYNDSNHYNILIQSEKCNETLTLESFKYHEEEEKEVMDASDNEEEEVIDASETLESFKYYEEEEVMYASDNEEEEVTDASDNEEVEAMIDDCDNPSDYEEIEAMIQACDYPCDNEDGEVDSNIETKKAPIDGYVIILFLCKTVINIIYYETLKNNE